MELPNLLNPCISVGECAECYLHGTSILTVAAKTLCAGSALYTGQMAYSGISRQRNASISVFTQGYVDDFASAAVFHGNRWFPGINYPAALALRPDGSGSGQTPEIPAGAGSQRPAPLRAGSHGKMLLATLNTGARINEALALTRGDFRLAPPYPFVQLATLERTDRKATRTAGRCHQLTSSPADSVFQTPG